MSAAAMNIQAARTVADPHRQLRQACDEFAGMAFFGQLLKQARDSSLNTGLLDSPGQRIFRQQLDDALIQRSSDKLGFSLGEALYQRLAPSLGKASQAGTTVDIQA